MLNDLSIELTEEQVRAFAHIFTESFEVALRTPRVALRYANAVRFGLTMISREVNVVDYMVLEAMRFFYPEIYALIRDKGDQIIRRYHVDRFKERAGEVFSAKLDLLSKDDRKAVVSVLQFLMPQLQAVFSNMHYGPEYLGEWAANRRLCSADYFERYFRMVIGAEDISDVAIGDVIRAAGAEEVERLREIMHDLIGSSNAEVFIRKMRNRADDLGTAAAEKLCIAIAGLGESFSDEGLMMDVSVSVKAPWMIDRIIERRITKNRQNEIAKRVVEEAKPPYFAADILSSLRPSSDKSHQKPLSESDAEQLTKKLALRIKDEFTKIIPWERFPHSFMGLMRVWAVVRSKTETQAYLKKRLRKDRKTCFDFLLKCTGKSYPLDTGIPSPQDFEKNHLDVLATIVDPKVVAEQVRKYVGTELDITNYCDTSRFEWPERIAAQFLWVYKHGGQVAKSGGETIEE